MKVGDRVQIVDLRPVALQWARMSAAGLNFPNICLNQEGMVLRIDLDNLFVVDFGTLRLYCDRAMVRDVNSYNPTIEAGTIICRDQPPRG